MMCGSRCPGRTVPEGGGNILVVDDNPRNLRLLLEILAKEGFEVRPVKTGALALESVRALPPDLVLLDIRMPEMDGYEVCRHLKEQEQTREIPVIFISALEEVVDKIRAFDVGGVDFISKPFQAEEITARVRTHLALRKAQKELARYREHLEDLVGLRTVELTEANKKLREEITERKQVEEALRASEQSLSEAQRIARLGHWDWDIVKNTLYWSDEIYRIFGLAPRQFGATYEAFLDTVHPEDRGFVRRSVEEALYEKTPYSIDHRIVLPDGAERIVHEQAEVTFDEIGRPIRMAGTVNDITVRKRSEKALSESEERFRNLSRQFEALLDAISDPLVLLTPEMKPVWKNRAYVRVIEKAAGSPKGLAPLFGIGPPHPECPASACFLTGRREEDVLTTADNRTWGVKAFPLKDKDGKVAQVIAMATDITEKIRLREETVRAARLASLGELAAGIAHEINNPNAIILLNTPILRDAFRDTMPILEDYCRDHGDFSIAGLTWSELRDQIPSLLLRIQESGERIKTIVDDLKDFIRHEDRRKFERVSLNEVVEASERLLANTIKKSTDLFRIEYSEGLPDVKGCFQHLEQVVVNLVHNACQALTDRKQGVFVATSYDKRKKMAVIRVKDEGGGIAAENLPHVTDPFFTTKREIGGTGLGLSVSARILEDHGGKLQISSTPGKGTVFSVFLPIWPEKIDR